MKRLTLIHTSATLVPVFQDLCKKHLGDKDVEVYHISDDSLIKNTIQRNELTADTKRRVTQYIRSAEESGADYIMVTCSSIGPAVEMGADLVEVPVLRVDRPMADHAIETGSRIGVAATLPTTLGPTADLIQRRAAAAGKEIELNTDCVEGAFEALMSGQAEEHDAKVAGSIRNLMTNSDVIVLAQASMARVVESIPEKERTVPILASPPLAMEYLAQVL